MIAGILAGLVFFSLFAGIGENFLAFLFSLRQSLIVEFFCQFLQFVLHMMVLFDNFSVLVLTSNKFK